MISTEGLFTSTVRTTLSIALLGVGSAFAATPPTPVSPLSDTGLAVVEARCPTFSWTTVPNRGGYELVVYRVSGDGDQLSVDAVPTLTKKLPGAANSWTPTMEACLTGGERYAWSIRPLGSGDPGEWSKPALFAIATPPAPVTLEQVMAALRLDPSTGGGATRHRPAPGTATETAQRPAPSAATTGGPSFEVDSAGNAFATSFTGSGAGLSNVAASTAAALSTNPTNCGAGFAPLGIAANGNAESCFDVATQGELVAFTPSALAANGANCAAGFASAGVSAAGAAEGCFDVATQAELGTHAGSADHDGRYLRLTGGVVNGPVEIAGTNDLFLNDDLFATGTLYWGCEPGYSRVGSWCISNTAGSGTYQQALEACHNTGASLCPYGALVTCDQVNLSTSSCNARTDGSTGDRTWILAIDGDSGDDTFDALTYEDDNTLDFTDGGESHGYYCCFPVNAQ